MRAVRLSRELSRFSGHAKRNYSSAQMIDMELNYAAHNYQPIPVVLAKGKGAVVEDVDGKEYLDFLSAYSAVNQGHCHPKIVSALVEQAQTLTLTSRAFHHNLFMEYAKLITETFGFDKVLPMNTGVEACETAVKLCRKWAYEVKGIDDKEAVVLFAENNFWGRSIAAVSSSSDPVCYTHFGPYLPGMQLIEYDNLKALEAVLESNKNIAGYMLEPIQGEAGVVVPSDGYLKGVRDLCTKYNVLMIADEVQTGIARTGKMLACDHESVKPDILILGKALSGGVYPVSATLASNEIMDCITPGTHGSTFGGNPLGCAVVKAAIGVVLDEDLAARAERLGQKFRETLMPLAKECDAVEIVRGKGLLNAMVVRPQGDRDASTLCLKLMENGVLAKPTHGDIIRFAPPLVITDAQLEQGLSTITNWTRELFT